MPPPPAWGCPPEQPRPRCRCLAAPARVGLPRRCSVKSCWVACRPRPRGVARPAEYKTAALPLPPPPAWGCHGQASDWRRGESCRPRPRGVATSSYPNNARRGLPPPPAWGCPRAVEKAEQAVIAAPARVGLPRSLWIRCSIRSCRPRPRGVAFLANRTKGLLMLPPPPAWGCPIWTTRKTWGQVAAPARVGLPDRLGKRLGEAGCRPRPRGVAVHLRRCAPIQELPPPPAWGCRHRPGPATASRVAAPARVGLPPPGNPAPPATSCRPRPRGVAASPQRSPSHRGLPPPPAWGCPMGTSMAPDGGVAAPARVGLPCYPVAGMRGDGCRPRPRGVAPWGMGYAWGGGLPPPPAWGCRGQIDVAYPLKIAAPARVGLPHARAL